MKVPETWSEYPCIDYCSSRFAESGWFDELGQYWYIERAGGVDIDPDSQLLVIGRPGVDGILWGYRKGIDGLWAYYPIDRDYVHIADGVEDLRDGYASGRITV